MKNFIVTILLLTFFIIAIGYISSSKKEGYRQADATQQLLSYCNNFHGEQKKICRHNMDNYIECTKYRSGPFANISSQYCHGVNTDVIDSETCMQDAIDVCNKNPNSEERDICLKIFSKDNPENPCRTIAGQIGIEAISNGCIENCYVKGKQEGWSDNKIKECQEYCFIDVFRQ